MSVRQSLLAILDQGPCYGYQLRAEFHRRTGSTWPLNVGQIYNTLDRLERDGLLTKGAIDHEGHVYYEITDAGRDEVQTWMNTSVVRSQSTRDELPIKLALAATLPGTDVQRIVHEQRTASAAALDALRENSTAQPSAATAESAGELFARELVNDAVLFHAEAELRWLDSVAERLAARAPGSAELELDGAKPRRGRPPRRASAMRSL